MKRYANKVIVVKFGGNAMGKKEYVNSFAKDVVFTFLRAVTQVCIALHISGADSKFRWHSHRNEKNLRQGTRNMIARQQSVAFTDPYTDKSKDLAGFVTADPAFPANAAGKKVGILSAQGTTIYYYSQAGTKFTADSVEEFDDKAAMYEALKAGIVDAVYGGEVDNEEFLASNSEYSFLHEEGGWTSGFAFACHPEYGDVVTTLNQGLALFKKTTEYTALCTKYPAIDCDTAEDTFENKKTYFS